MSELVITPEKTADEIFIETKLQQFTITPESLKELAGSFKGLKINGVNDKEGYAAVYEARQTLKKKRVEITNFGKNIRASAVAFQKAVIAKEESLVSIIEPIETSLYYMEKEIDAEKQRLKEEAQKLEDDRIQKMLDQLNAVNFAADIYSIKGMTEEQFQETLAQATKEHKEALEREELARAEEEARKKQEAEELIQKQKELKEQQERLAKEQAAQKAKELEWEKEKEAIRREREAIEAEKKAIQDRKDAEERERIAVENARIETEKRIEREAKEKLEREKLEKEEAEQKLLEGTDKEKFVKLSNDLNDLIKSPIWTSFKSKKGKIASFTLKQQLEVSKKLCNDNSK